MELESYVFTGDIREGMGLIKTSKNGKDWETIGNTISLKTIREYSPLNLLEISEDKKEAEANHYKICEGIFDG